MQQTSKTFDLGPTAPFDEGVIATCSRFWFVRQYNKDNTDKFRIDLFLRADSTHYFVRHIDIYQGNNSVNIDIHARATNLSTAIKVVVNGIITAGVVNDPNGARELFLDNRHACPELLSILEEKVNVLAGGTCRKNRK